MFQSSPAKVRMVVDSHNNTPREMTFESARVRKNYCLYYYLEYSFLSYNSLSGSHLFQKRHAFCQLLQLMKTRHSQLRDPDVISVFVGTWNMGNHECGDGLFHCQATEVELEAEKKLLKRLLLFIVLFCVHRWFPSSSQPAVVGDLLRFGAHPWWFDRLAPSWYLCLGDSGKPSGGERMDRTYKSNPSQLHSHRL